MTSNKKSTLILENLVTRRTALVSAAAAALVLLPTAAFAYEAPGFQGELSTPAPVAGTPFAFGIQGNADIAGKSVLLTVRATPDSIPDSAIQIAGVNTKEKEADANGDVSFAVTLTQAGTYSAVATVDGVKVASQDFGVVAASTSSSSSKAVASGDALAATGFDGAGLATGAGALVLAGAGAVMVAKRRQSAHVGA